MILDLYTMCDVVRKAVFMQCQLLGPQLGVTDVDVARVIR